MKNPKIKVEIKHSQSKNAWNIIGTQLGGKYKIARVPYNKIENSEELSHREKDEAFRHAEFICFCLNNSNKILENINQ